MIIIRLIFFIVSLFFGLSMLLGALAWLKLRAHVINPFDKHPRTPPGGNVIEGQYEVLDDEMKAKDNHKV